MKLTGALIVLAIPGTVALIALAAMLNGWVLTHLWQWFVVPFGYLTPFGIKPLGLAHAIGLSMIVSYMVKPHVETKGWAAVLTLGASPLFALLFGYIVKSFM